MSNPLLEAKRKRRERADVSAFKGLIATPAADTFKMRANGRLRFVSIGGCAAGTTAAVLTGPTVRTIKTKLLPAGGSVIVDNVGIDVSVNPSAGFRVELAVGLGRWKQIATGA